MIVQFRKYDWFFQKWSPEHVGANPERVKNYYVTRKVVQNIVESTINSISYVIKSVDFSQNTKKFVVVYIRIKNS